MSQSPAWSMLKDSLVDKLEGYHVRNALFTTYAFEPEFFETNIVPLLLNDRGASLSLHTVVRRLQLECILRETPLPVDVYFDARVVAPGVPWLPYGMHPVKLAGEFHGKVILLLLEDESRNIHCLLGAGSANLTRAGWWENVEAWHFEGPFDPQRPPAGMLEGIQTLLEALPRRQGSALAQFKAAFKDARPTRKRGAAKEFVAFTPQKDTRFLEWISRKVNKESTADAIEVISPYFPETGHGALVARLLESTGTRRLHLWLPEDTWYAGGQAALIEKKRYLELTDVKDLTWCRFIESSLAKCRDKNSTPRFLHTKVIRRQGDFVFMGSVNFSNKAFDLNFEAGFLFDDTGPEWLTGATERPVNFIAPTEVACHDTGIEDMPTAMAVFNWQTLCLSIDFGKSKHCQAISGKVADLLDASGQPVGIRIRVPLEGEKELTVPVDGPLYQSLRNNCWIKLEFRSDGNAMIIWVQQADLAFRPPPVGLEPDLWSVLDMWRGLGAGKAGSQPGDFAALEVMLSRLTGSEEEVPEVADSKDIFAPIATVHGSLYALRQVLFGLKLGEPRLHYYLSSPQVDTLPSLLQLVEKTLDAGGFDVVEVWVILMWVVQIGRDHQKLAPGRVILSTAQRLLDRLHGLPVMAAVDPLWMRWVAEMFLCRPGWEAAVTRGFE